jgi:hypothetical protein
MTKAKYIKTKYKKIIVFSELQVHSEFKIFEPVSAGFIIFYVSENGNPSCECYGQSISLGIGSDTEDTSLARQQIIGLSY